MGFHRYIERKTSLIYGTYRWDVTDGKSEPAPRFGLVLRPPNDLWVRVEVIVFGHAFYLTWGRQA